MEEKGEGKRDIREDEKRGRMREMGDEEIKRRGGEREKPRSGGREKREKVECTT